MIFLINSVVCEGEARTMIDVTNGVDVVGEQFIEPQQTREVVEIKVGCLPQINPYPTIVRLPCYRDKKNQPRLRGFVRTLCVESRKPVLQ